jgi:hypothetical protein
MSAGEETLALADINRRESADCVEKHTESLAVSLAGIFIFGTISEILGIFAGCGASSSF